MSHSTAAISLPTVNRIPPVLRLKNLAPATTTSPTAARLSIYQWILILHHNISSSSMMVLQSHYPHPRWPPLSHRHALPRLTRPISCHPSFASIPRLLLNTRDSIIKDSSRRLRMIHIASSRSRISTRNNPTGPFHCPISPLIGKICVWMVF